MALIKIDGFDYYTGAASIKYSHELLANASINDFVTSTTQTRNSPRSMYANVSVGGEGVSSLAVPFADSNTCTIGTALYLQDGGMHSSQREFLIQFFSGANVRNSTNCAGFFEIWQNTIYFRYFSGTSKQTIAIPISWNNNTWSYFEFQYNATNTKTGSFVLRQDEQMVYSGDIISSTATTISPGAVNTIRIGKNNTIGASLNLGYTYIDDMYIRNDAQFMGDVSVKAIYPSGSGTQTNFSVGSGITGWMNVNETGGPITGNYVYSSTSGDIDLYEFTNLTGENLQVRGVQTNFFYTKDETQTRGLTPLYSGSSLESGTTGYASLGSYNYLAHVWENNPLTDAAWTQNEINSGQWGMISN